MAEKNDGPSLGLDAPLLRDFSLHLNNGTHTMTNMVKLSKFPMPPSVNEMYANNWKAGRGRFKTKEYIAFDNICHLWVLKNQKTISDGKLLLKQAPFLEIDCVFYFPESRILTKKGMPKRLDVDNRVKALLDKVSKIFELDDSSFFRHTYHKLVAVDNYCDLTISILSKQDLYPTLTVHKVGGLTEH